MYLFLLFNADLNDDSLNPLTSLVYRGTIKMDYYVNLLLLISLRKGDFS